MHGLCKTTRPFHSYLFRVDTTQTNKTAHELCDGGQVGDDDAGSADGENGDGEVVVVMMTIKEVFRMLVALVGDGLAD